MSVTPTPPSPPTFSTPDFGEYSPKPGQIVGVGFWPRVAARVIDLAVHFVTTLAGSLVFFFALGVAAALNHVPVAGVVAKIQSGVLGTFIAGILGSTVYEVVCEAGHGSTMGKLILGMTVVQEDGSFCGFKAAIIRSFAYFVDSLFFGIIGYLAMQGSISHQRNGDKWAHTVVAKRSHLRPEQLRSGGRFAGVFLLAVMLDAATLMVGLTLQAIS